MLLQAGSKRGPGMEPERRHLRVQRDAGSRNVIEQVHLLVTIISRTRCGYKAEGTGVGSPFPVLGHGGIQWLAVATNWKASSTTLRAALEPREFDSTFEY
jgi:hypothetical protein